MALRTWRIVASVAFRVYLHFFNSYSKTYGSLGAVMILLLWFYITGMMLLMGAEVNAEIENAAAVPAITAAVVAEARFFRAFDYFLLVQTFGGVPLDLGAGRFFIGPL